MRIMVTGGAGFIGSALVRRLVSPGSDVLVLDKLTYAGRIEWLEPYVNTSGFRFVQGDICESAIVERCFEDFQPDAVLHLAAESHVDRSIDGPEAFLETNVRGTHILLRAARGHHDRRGDAGFRFIHVSTDEVFGELGPSGHFDEDSRYAPNSPYSASKAASDHLVRAWHATYGLPAIVTNCSNNYGPRQHAEKLVPTIIRCALGGAPIPIYGNGRNVRDWIFVDDHADGIVAALLRGRPGATYLFGGRCELENLSMAGRICEILDEASPSPAGRSYKEQIVYVSDRPGHDFRYAIDPRRTEAELGWKANTQFPDGIRTTVEWYLANPGALVSPSELGRLGTGRAEVLP
jgi:dTDP-glucose 4,6-dehydratase